MMGGKAQSLQRLQREGFPVPPFFVVAPDEALDERRLRRRCARLGAGTHEARFAVRASACAEDGSANSYAGMFETFLFVPPEQIAERIARVRTCGDADRVRAYDLQRGARRAHEASAIVQVMIDADVAGVAFSRDPVTGSDAAVICASYGLGSGIVGGDCDADTYRVSPPAGEILERRIAHKSNAHRRGATTEGVASVPVPDALADLPALSDANVLRVAALVREVTRRFGQAQDIEWALNGETLYVLQARPITTPAPVIWDNSNIAESYGGLVSPLTYSFAVHAYAGAYAALMAVFGIDRRKIAAQQPVLQALLGLVRGRMYYNLLNWYHMLALVPGFALNRRFMENMMGVPEALPDSLAAEIERTGKARDMLAVVKMLSALTYRYMRLDSDVRRFHRHVERSLAASPALHDLRVNQLHAEFARLEADLLNRWQAPLVNDFFAMVFYGVLRALTKRWCADADGCLHNDLLCASGGMVSAEPARLIAEMAEMVRRNQDISAVYEVYLERFGERCANELKLESLTLREDPAPLLRAVAALAASPPRSTGVNAYRARDVAEKRVALAVRGKPLRRAILSAVVKHTRARIRDRENLRLERTRVFARIREIVREIGARLHAAGALEDPRDVFYLELAELRSTEPARIVAERKRAYAEYATLAAPPNRFTSQACEVPDEPGDLPDAGDPRTRSGIGCCPGIVRGRARVVQDARGPLLPGEILVAERTDPGWVVLFPAASAIVVERGSVLSHAAIVSREMGIPSVVGVAGVTRWLRDGDSIEVDGRSGIVRRLEPGAIP